MNAQRIVSRVLDGLILFVFILFFSSAGFQDRNTSGWYQQWFPNLSGSTIKDITFLDSLTGFAITTTDPSLRSFILKTTNGGDNWNFVHTYTTPATSVSFYRILFANSNTGYACVNYNFVFFKTTNAGENWVNISSPWGFVDMQVINSDTVIGVSSSGFDGGVFRSTNGGYNWQAMWSGGSSGNPQKIYMVNKDLGFTQDEGLSNYMKRTTNGGFNWAEISGEKFTDIVFSDSNTGWKVYDSIKKTTNGGINWFIQHTPIKEFWDNTGFSVLNKDSVWMVGAFAYGGVVLKTINGGTNWGYQFPNPTFPIAFYNYVQFVDSKNGWVNNPNYLLHTKVGGNDTTYITNINNNINVELSDYQLFQNYPNPFNTRTVIRYIVTGSPIRTFGDDPPWRVMLKVYDINGREAATLVNTKLNPGMYEAVFDGSEYSSGIYFYTLIIDGKAIDTKRMILLK